MFETVMHALGFCGENHPSVLWLWVNEMRHIPVFSIIKNIFR